VLKIKRAVATTALFMTSDFSCFSKILPVILIVLFFRGLYSFTEFKVTKDLSDDAKVNHLNPGLKTGPGNTASMNTVTEAAGSHTGHAALSANCDKVRVINIFEE